MYLAKEAVRIPGLFQDHVGYWLEKALSRLRDWDIIG